MIVPKAIFSGFFGIVPGPGLPAQTITATLRSMRVIKKPRPTSEFTYHIKCKNPKCEAEFEARESELRAVSDQRDGDALVLTCQFCKTETWVSAIDNPNRWTV